MEETFTVDFTAKVYGRVKVKASSYEQARKIVESGDAVYKGMELIDVSDLEIDSIAED